MGQRLWNLLGLWLRRLGGQSLNCAEGCSWGSMEDCKRRQLRSIAQVQWSFITFCVAGHYIGRHVQRVWLLALSDLEKEWGRDDCAWRTDWANRVQPHLLLCWRRWAWWPEPKFLAWSNGQIQCFHLCALRGKRPCWEKTMVVKNRPFLPKQFSFWIVDQLGW